MLKNSFLHTVILVLKQRINPEKQEIHKYGLIRDCHKYLKIEINPDRFAIYVLLLAFEVTSIFQSIWRKPFRSFFDFFRSFFGAPARKKRSSGGHVCEICLKWAWLRLLEINLGENKFHRIVLFVGFLMS
jgi:hypothetical protein